MPKIIFKFYYLFKCNSIAKWLIANWWIFFWWIYHREALLLMGLPVQFFCPIIGIYLTRLPGVLVCFSEQLFPWSLFSSSDTSGFQFVQSVQFLFYYFLFFINFSNCWFFIYFSWIDIFNFWFYYSSFVDLTNYVKSWGIKLYLKYG